MARGMGTRRRVPLPVRRTLVARHVHLAEPLHRARADHAGHDSAHRVAVIAGQRDAVHLIRQEHVAISGTRMRQGAGHEGACAYLSSAFSMGIDAP